MVSAAFGYPKDVARIPTNRAMIGEAVAFITESTND